MTNMNFIKKYIEYYEIENEIDFTLLQNAIDKFAKNDNVKTLNDAYDIVTIFSLIFDNVDNMHDFEFEYTHEYDHMFNELQTSINARDNRTLIRNILLNA